MWGEDRNRFMRYRSREARSRISDGVCVCVCVCPGRRAHVRGGGVGGDVARGHAGAVDAPPPRRGAGRLAHLPRQRAGAQQRERTHTDTTTTHKPTPPLHTAIIHPLHVGTE